MYQKNKVLSYNIVILSIAQDDTLMKDFFMLHP